MQPRALPVQNTQHTDDWLSLPIFRDDTPIALLISGLRKKASFNSNRTFSARVQLGLKTRVDELMLALEAKGYCHLEGFRCEESGIGRGPMMPIVEPIPVRVVSSRSQHDVCNGPLLIHQNQSFRDFYEAVIACRPVHVSLPPKGGASEESVEQASDAIFVECAGGCIRIRLKRTLRLPDDDKVYDLPAEFRSFPLFNAAQFQKTLPEAMELKGGLLVAMYQREAMFLEFDFWGRGPHCRRMALRVLMGGVNTISGEAKQSGDNFAGDTQDYIVIPGQKWLDGFRVSQNEVRQFVAMPMGLGYSVEKQITSEEFVGGIQLEILRERPPKLELDCRDMTPQTWRSDGVVRSPASANPLGVDGRITPRSLGLKPGDTFDLSQEVLDVVKFYYPEYRSHWKPQPDCECSAHEGKRATLIRDFMPSTGALNGEIRLAAVHDVLPLCSAGVTIAHNGLQIYPEPAAPGHPSTAGRRNPTLFDLGITPFSTIDITCPSPPMPIHPSDPQLDHACACPPSWEMAVATGSRIKQHIFADPDPWRWESEPAGMLNIQILNAVAFTALTGRPGPPTPITAAAYAAKGFPFFAALNEDAPLTTAAARALTGLRSVGAIDRARAREGRLGLAPRVDPGAAAAGCTACGPVRRVAAGLAERIVRPCNHAVCGACWVAVNGGRLGAGAGAESKEDECPVCRRRAVGTVLFLAPMGMWEAERHLGCALQDVQLVML
ncbi:hypothetical protein VTK56DRAFT_1269 [Thermocarpiscus australiensis]